MLEILNKHEVALSPFIYLKYCVTYIYFDSIFFLKFYLFINIYNFVFLKHTFLLKFKKCERSVGIRKHFADGCRFHTYMWSF